MANSADPDQLAFSEANWSGATLFAKAGYIRNQQDKGENRYGKELLCPNTSGMYIASTTLLSTSPGKRFCLTLCSKYNIVVSDNTLLQNILSF